MHNGFILLTIFVLSTGLIVVFAQHSKMEVAATDDAYVVSDLNDPADKLRLQKLNTGNLKFLKVWYVWNVNQATNNKVMSLAYLNFDLSHLSQDQIHSARLMMYAQNVTLSGISRSVDLHLASNSTWSESTLTFSNAPSFSANPIATTSVSQAGWYQWNITNTAVEKAGSKLTVVVILQKLIHKNEEQVIFASNDVDDPSLRPRLVIETLSESAPVSSDNITLVLAAVIAIGAAGGAAGFVFYRKRDKELSTTQVSPKASEEIFEFCPNCSKKIAVDFNICPFCGSNLKRLKCSSCGKDVLGYYKLCPYCGSKISL